METKVEYKDATWSQMRDGSWGIRVQSEVVEGDIVKTQTRGGKTTYESVGKVVWVGRNNATDGSVAYTLATIGPKPEIKKPRGPRKPKAPKAAKPIDALTALHMIAEKEEAKEEARRPRADDDDLPY